MRRPMPIVAFVAVVLIGLTALGLQPGARAQEGTPVTEAVFENVTLEVIGAGPVPNYPPQPAEIALLRLRFAPGGRLRVPADDPGMAIHSVEAGTITVRFSAAVVVVRGAALTQEQVPAETEFTLAAGDSFIAPSPSGGEFRNDGTEEAIVLIAVIGPAAVATPTA